MYKRTIPFSKFNRLGLIFTLVVTTVLLGITVYRGGFNLGIDFRSGQTIDVLLEQAQSTTDIKQVLLQDYPQVQVSKVGNSATNSYNIKLASTVENQEEDLAKVISLLQASYGSVEVQNTSFIGSTISQTLLRSVVFLMLGALTLILGYIWLRFKFQYAVAAILATLHDALFIIGIVGAFQFEVTISTVAAILTIIGYSLNDTIVIFDRIRENIIMVREGNFNSIANKSLTQTLSRTIITSFTTILAILALIFFASGDIFNFARTLLIGVLEGTWSSLFIATPILSLFNTKKLLVQSRAKQGSGVLYKVDSDDKELPEDSTNTKKLLTEKSQSSSGVTNTDVERIKAEVLARHEKKHHKKR